MNILIADAGRYYREKFGEPECIVSSPGRINLIGEHTDYNQGWVMPAAIDNAVYVSAGRRSDQEIQVYAVNYDELLVADASNLTKASPRWSDYVLGVVAVLQKHGYPVSGFQMVLRGDIPEGAGLSSSAAVECAVLFALDHLFGWQIPRKTMALLAQEAEHSYAGVQCGIMDQFASLFGKQDHLLQLDCRTMDFRYLPWDSNDVELLLFNTKVKHELASSEYNQRRLECEAGVALLKQYDPRIQSLRDVSPDIVEKVLSGAEKEIYQRCLYVTEEISRVEAAAIDLEKGDMEAFGKKMFATHRGLRDLYQVSCPELDALVSWAQQDSFVLGARMMGGGFGGCTINLVRKGAASGVIDKFNEKYLEQFGCFLEAYPVKIMTGTTLVDIAV
ncbi:MAG: galactokinase [Chitinophagaceae bacterium]|nr:galactokinase [Chitinophagaceae bacterium]